MSAIAHISRPTSGIAPIELSNIEDDDEQDRGAAIGVALSCDDMSGAGDELRLYSFYKTQHKAIDLVRATVIKPATISAAAAVALGGTVRATFSSPVMSRRHAHIAFSENGLITISDTGSLHGTYIQTSSGTLAKLTPHRPYVLHSGNVVLLGKSVYRDDRYWKPVIVRVTILHAESGLSASPALGPSTPLPDAQRTPNRYGMYVGSAGVSSFDGDEDVDSMSLSSEDDDSEDISSDSSQRLPSSSPATSPIHPLKLGLGLPPCTSGSGSNATSENSDAVAANVTSTTTDGNFSSSSLRAILPFPFNFSLSRLSGSGTGTETEIAPGLLHQLPRPQLPFSQFPLLRPLPSLRDLGFFGAAVGRGLNRSLSHSQNDDANTDAYIGTRKVENESGNAEQKLNENENEVQNEPHSAYPFSPVSESDLAHHPYAYASPPSFPENQLGLADAELRFVDDGEDDHDEDVLGYDGRNYKREGSSASCDVDHDEHEYESSNEDAAVASVSLKLKQHRNVRGRSSIIRTEDVDDAEEAPMEISPSPSRDASPSPRAQHARVVIDVDEIESQEDEDLARPAMVGAWPSEPEPEPERSLGRSRSGERWPSRIQESISRHNARMLDFLKAQQSTSASSSAPGIASTSMLLPASAAAQNAIDFDELHAALDDGAREELQGMREEMRRLSALMEDVIAKIDTHTPGSKPEPHAESEHIEQAVQTNEIVSNDIEGRPESEEPLSRKRKRDDEEDNNEEARDRHSLLAEKAIAETDAEDVRGVTTESLPIPVSESQSESSLQVRPAKRIRLDAGGTSAVARNVAAAAGYTTLGAALTWATLAYAL